MIIIIIIITDRKIERTEQNVERNNLNIHNNCKFHSIA